MKPFRVERLYCKDPRPRPSTPLAGDGDQIAQPIERERHFLAGVLAVNVRLSSRLAVVGCRHTLDSLAGGIGNQPDFLVDDAGETGDEVVNVHGESLSC